MPKIQSLIKNVITQPAAGGGGVVVVGNLESQRLFLPVLVLKDNKSKTKADGSCFG